MTVDAAVRVEGLDAPAAAIDGDRRLGRVLHVITDFRERGGAESAMARLLNAQPAWRRLDVISLGGASPAMRGLIQHPNATVSGLGARSASSAPAATLRLALAIRRLRPDLVMAWMYHANAIAALATHLPGARTPLVWNVRHSLNALSAEGRSTRTAIAAGKALIGLPRAVIYNSRRSQAEHAAAGYGRAPSHVIHNGLPMAAAAPRAPRKPAVIGVAGRFHPAKDYPTFLAAAALISAARPAARFVCAGRQVSFGNPDFARLVLQTGAPAHRIRAMDEVSDMASFYDGLDVLVLPSRTEGFPNVVAEAMARGAPCVVTDVGDAAELVGDTGFVVPPGDPPALARAIIAALDLSPSDYAARSHAARRRVEAICGLDRAAAAFEAVMAGVL